MTRRPLRFHLGLALLALSLPSFGQEAAEDEGISRVYVMPIEGDISDTTASFVERVVAQAIRAKADVLLVEIDTPGGSVEAMKEIVESIDEAEKKGIRTVAFVTNWAGSAGSLIAMACRDLYMRPRSTIGAAEPKNALTGQTDEKYVSFLRTIFKSWAERRGRPANLAMAMVDADLEVWQVVVRGPEGIETLYLTPDELWERFGIRGEVIRQLVDLPKDLPEWVREGTKPPHKYDRDPYVVGDATVAVTRPITVPGKLLTLTAEQAVEYGVAQGLADGRDATLEAVGVEESRVVEMKPTWAEGIVSFLTHPVVSIILVVIGIIGIGIEMLHPGFGAPGIVGLVALGVFFAANWVAGLASVLDIVLIVIGLVLLGVEIFVLPGFGVAGVSGILLVLGGLVLTFQDFAIPRDAVDVQILVRSLFYVTLAIAGTVVAGFLAVRYLPETKAFQGMTAAVEMKASDGYTVAKAEHATLVGARGQATTPLRPAGKAMIREELRDVVTRGEFIEAGVLVEVVDVRANRILVQAAEPRA